MSTTGPASHFDVLTPLEFIKDVTHEARRAKIRVWAQAMEVEPGKITDTFLQTIENAAKQGLDTRLHADHYSLMVSDGVFNYWPFVSRTLRGHREESIREKEMLYRRLTRHGVRFLYTNPPTPLDRVFPMRGRNHMKMTIVDDIAWIGGVNLHDGNFDSHDLMVKITERAIVHEIAYVYEQIDREEPIRDMAVTCDTETTLLVDGGRINRSIILRHAIELVKGANNTVTVVSPLIPDAGFLRALHTARSRGVNITVISPKTARMTGIYTWVDTFNELVMKLRGLSLPIQFKNRMVHAKILLVDESVAMVGSHNFSSRGVRMGTEEIALKSTDTTLVKNLLSFCEDLEKRKEVR